MNSNPPENLLPLLGVMFLGYELPALAQALARLDDGLPLPAVFDWQAPEPVELAGRFSQDEIKTVVVFEQILQQKRKSGKYYQEMKSLAERHPTPELEALLVTYLTQWLPGEAEQRIRNCLAEHPDWLLLRSLWATRVLMEAAPEQMPLALVVFLERMQDKLELHQHLDGPVREDLVNVFYSATALFFLHADQPERALYSLNVIAASGARDYALKLLEQLLNQVDAQGQRDRLQAFIGPLQSERRKAQAARRARG